MEKVIKNTKGITLVAIAVTIIVLMILAGITLGLVLGQNGIITKAQYAKVQSEIGSEKEQLSMTVTEATLDNNGKQPTLEQIKDKIVEKGITTAENIKIGDDRLQVTTPKGHTYTIDDKGNVEYIGEGTVTVPNLTDANLAFTYTPSDWTNENVQVSIETIVKGFALQYSTDGSTWNDYTSSIKASSNETIYARLWDGINYGGIATGNITNIDKTNPTLTISTTNTTNSITITATAADNESGIEGYKYSKDNGSTWTEITTNNTYTYTGLTQGQANQIVVEASDKAGNTVSKNVTVTTGSVTGLTSANTTFTYTPSSGWTNGNVQVGITTTETGNTLQYSTDGSTWNNYTGAITITNNQAIYARLYDGTNYGGVATGNVTNIDKSAPSKTVVNLNGYTSGTTTAGDVTQTYSATDNVGISKYQCSNDGGATWFDVPNPWVINWNGQWTLSIRAVDYAGNIGPASDAYSVSRNYVAIKAQVGGFVNYTAGTWTQADINLLSSQGIYAGGDMAIYNNSYYYYRFEGFNVGNSKDSSITINTSLPNKYSSGWRVLDLNTDGSIKDIVHAGTPEEYYHSLDSSESTTTMTNRSWNMYVNSTYATSAHCMTYNEAYAITQSESATDNDLRKTGSSYWLASPYNGTELYIISSSGSINGSMNGACGIRPVVTLKSGIQLVGGSGTWADPYRIN